MLFNRKKKKNLLFNLKKKHLIHFLSFSSRLTEMNLNFVFIWEKTVPANRDPGSSMPRSRFAGTVFSHINAILFLVRFVSQTRSRQTEGLG